MTSDIRFFYMTAPSADVADELAKALVAGRHAACVNILPGMRSVYHWEGAIEEGQELVLIAKSVAGQADDIARILRDIHPDETPCLTALTADVAASSPAFCQWIAEETKT